MTDKLRLLVRMDVDGAQVRIAARGRVTSQSLHALYLVVKRANTLMHSLALDVDVTGARVDTAALEELQLCSKAHHLPFADWSQQSDINIHIRSSRSALGSSRAA